MKVTVLVATLEEARPYFEDLNIVDETIASAKELEDEALSPYEKTVKTLTLLSKTLRLIGQLITLGPEAINGALVGAYGGTGFELSAPRGERLKSLRN